VLEDKGEETGVKGGVPGSRFSLLSLTGKEKGGVAEWNEGGINWGARTTSGP